MPRPLTRAVKPELNKDSSRIIIFTEGFDREPNYFRYFQRLNSRINIHIEPSSDEGSNPLTLLDIAKRNFIEDLDVEGDQLWFVIDTDQWEAEIEKLRLECSKISKLFIAQSNPCFEVWLYFHFYDKIEEDAFELKSTDWKFYLNAKVKGGFDSRKHPSKILEAINNASKCYKNNNDVPEIGCTQVHLLANEIYPIVKDYL